MLQNIIKSVKRRYPVIEVTPWKRPLLGKIGNMAGKLIERDCGGRLDELGEGRRLFTLSARLAV